MRLALPLIALAAAWVLLLLDREPVPTWFYVFAWYPTLALFDELAARLQRGARVLAQPALVFSLFGWSVPIWLFFEAVNFRLANWYYVYLPRSPAERWAGIVLSFATVVPAVILAERLLSAAGFARHWRRRPLALGLRDVRVLAWAGALGLAAVLLLPDRLYPLTWGVAFLLADPVVYRRRPEWSLLADIERGEWGRIARLMAAGLLIGGIWEGYNYVARGKWIYTLPLLEDVKWFEMPPLGFVGFSFFALEAWAMYHVLASLGVALPALGPTPRPAAAPVAATAVEPPSPGSASGRRGAADFREPRPSGARQVVLAVAGAALFSIATLAGMERWTTSSTVPVVVLPGPAAEWSAWRLARLAPERIAAAAGIPLDSARKIREHVRLATLRGIGTAHASRLETAGIHTICQLAASDPGEIWHQLRKAHPELGRRPTEAEVRVWVRAARRACPSGVGSGRGGSRS